MSLPMHGWEYTFKPMIGQSLKRGKYKKVGLGLPISSTYHNEIFLFSYIYQI